MKFHLDYALKLNTEPQYKNLYSWAINEVDAEERLITRDQIPWDWTLYFSATSCVLTNRFEIERPFSLRGENDDPPKIEAGHIIRMTLRPGRRVNGEIVDDIAFSMFGTKRPIHNFTLEVRTLDDPDKLEYCAAWGCVSYTSEVDFRNKTVDDWVWFYLYVKPEAFAKYTALISQGAISTVLFAVGLVDGFYSDWSPSTSTTKVKVLARGGEQKLDLPHTFEDKPPRLGRVREARLLIERHLDFEKVASPTLAMASHMSPDITQVDPRVLRIMTSLKRAAWIAVAILVAIAMGTLFKS